MFEIAFKSALKTALRRWLTAAFLGVLTLTVTWAVRAEIGRAHVSTPAYTNPAGITGASLPKA